jgi:hypothetical protein
MMPDKEINGWEETAGENETRNIQYVFSGDRLILVFDGEPITFSRDYTDFSNGDINSEKRRRNHDFCKNVNYLSCFQELYRYSRWRMA